VTNYIAAYDTEQPECLAACRKIVEVHRRHEMPATFFIVGKVLEADAAAYRRLLDDPLFEIASHSWSHGMLLEHPFCGPGLPLGAVAEELTRGRDAVEKVFERPCVGLRPACCFDEGLRGAAEVLELVHAAGFQYVSSLAWGPDYTMPALLRRPFTYAHDGFPDLWELPAHGWQDNLLKDNNRWGPRRLTLWPPSMPEAIPPGFVKTPREEFDVHDVFLSRAGGMLLQARLPDGGQAEAWHPWPHVSLIWHPWSLDRFDPEMEMLELVFGRVRELGLTPTTFAGLRQRLAGGGA